MKALEWQRKCDQWTKDNGQFVPNPETWLNQGRWNDEPQEILTPAYKPPVFLGA
jgi:transcription elongation factor